MPELFPRLDVLPPAQKRLWPELSAIPKEFVLYGDTALALHLGHRESADFDFFGGRKFDARTFETGIPFLKGAKIIQRAEDTLTAIVDRGGPVRISFFGVPELPRLQPPLVAKDNGLQVASLLDLAGTKASVIQVRAQASIDMDALVTLGKVSLSTALAAAAKIYGSSFNPQITLKALSNFDDGNLRTLAEEVKLRLITAVRAVDLDHLPGIGHPGRDLGQEP